MNLKKVLTNINFEPSYLFSLIQNAATALNDITIAPHSAFDSKKSKLRQNILSCADTLGDSFTEWPEQFKRRSLQEIETLSNQPQKSPLYKAKEPVLSPEPAGSHTAVTLKHVEERFDLRTQVNPTVLSRPLPPVPSKSAPEILNFLIGLVQQNYEMLILGQALEKARDNIRKIAMHTSYLFEMSKYANLYQKKAPRIGLNALEKREITERLQKWLIEASHQ